MEESGTSRQIATAKLAMKARAMNRPKLHRRHSLKTPSLAMRGNEGKVSYMYVSLLGSRYE